MPVIIWRSGGDGAPLFGEQLLRGTGLGEVLIEPFRQGAPWHELGQGWGNPWKRNEIDQQLRTTLNGQQSLVHTVDAGDDHFHQGLARAASKLGYRHIVLHRRAGDLRLAAWLAAADDAARAEASRGLHRFLKQDSSAMMKLARVRQALRSSQHQRHILALDDLGSAKAERVSATWDGLFEFLGKAVQAVQQPLLAAALDAQEQPLAASLAASPHREMLELEAQWLPNLDVTPAFLRPEWAMQASEKGPVRLTRFGVMPSVLYEGDEISFGGVVLMAGQPSTGKLVLSQGAHEESLKWALPSPAVATSHADEPGAANARFRAVTLKVKRQLPVHIVHRSGGGGGASKQVTPVATLRFEPAVHERVEGILLTRFSIGYQPIPKVACTSVKEAFFKLAAGRSFAAEVGGGAKHVHSYFDARATDISDARFRVLVVRDPIKRFLSGFSNRVIHHKELTREYLERQPNRDRWNLAEFPFNPDVNQFVANFDFYRSVPTIDHHFRPITEFVSPFSAFDKVYPFEALDEFCSDIAKWADTPRFTMPHTQFGGPKLSSSVLTNASIDKLLTIYAEDYAVLSQMYQADSWQRVREPNEA